MLHDSHKEYGYGPYVVFENNFDGLLEPFLEDLYVQAQNGLRQVYSFCEDYTVTNAADQALFAFLKSHVVLPNAYHIGNTGGRAERILQEQRLWGALEMCADGLLQDGRPRSAAARGISI